MKIASSSPILTVVSSSGSLVSWLNLLSCSLFKISQVFFSSCSSLHIRPSKSFFLFLFNPKIGYLKSNLRIIGIRNIWSLLLCFMFWVTKSFDFVLLRDLIWLFFLVQDSKISGSSLGSRILPATQRWVLFYIYVLNS